MEANSYLKLQAHFYLQQVTAVVIWRIVFVNYYQLIDISHGIIYKFYIAKVFFVSPPILWFYLNKLFHLLFIYLLYLTNIIIS